MKPKNVYNYYLDIDVCLHKNDTSITKTNNNHITNTLQVCNMVVNKILILLSGLNQ